MTWLSGYLPVEQGVACWAALQRATAAAKAFGDPRSRDQIMADTLVERLTGQTSADAVPFEVRITDAAAPAEPLSSAESIASARTTTPSVPAVAGSVGYTLPQGLRDRLDGALDAGRGQFGDGSLLDCDPPDRVVLLVPRATLTGGCRPGVLSGHGPVPAPLVRELIAASAGPVRFRVLASPETERVSRAPTFRGRLRERIEDRDQRCRDPYCDAPIRHLDHIRRRADGGPTSYLNGRGVCERGNYLRELPGWSVRLIDATSHTVQLITPTGHRYSSQAPQPP